MHATRYELLYFPVRGRAEPIRLLFAAAGVDFTDTRVTDWPTRKATTPFGKMPVLIERDDEGREFQVPESMAILRHLARVFGFAGESERATTSADAIAEALIDWRTRFTPVAFAQFAKTEQSVIDKYWHDLPATLDLFERLAGKHTGGYFVGDAPTYADLLAFDTIDGNLGMKPGILDGYPNLRALVARIREIPGVAAYLAARA